MSKLNKSQIEALTLFLQPFVDSAVKTLSHNLDSDVYKKIEFYISETSEINGISEFKDENIFYRVDYTNGQSLSTLGVLVPEVLLSNISDVLMGGEGNNKYSGTLSELEINAAKDLAQKIFGEMETSFKRKSAKEFGFGAEPSFLTKEMPASQDAFNSPEFDFLVDQKLKINGKDEYPIRLLLKTSDLIASTKSLNILQADPTASPNFKTNIGIDQLADIEIDITAQLGGARIPIKSALELVKGSLVKLDTLNDSDIKVFANDVEVARAQVVVVGDNFGLRITKIIAPEERIKLV